MLKLDYSINLFDKPHHHTQNNKWNPNLINKPSPIDYDGNPRIVREPNRDQITSSQTSRQADVTGLYLTFQFTCSENITNPYYMYMKSITVT